jgi:hypothetical protein
MAAGDGCGFFGITGKKLEEGFETLRIKREIWWKLPQDGAQLFAESHYARSEKIRESRFDIFKPKYVRDVARVFDGEDEIGWSFGYPALETRGSSERVEGAVDFDRAEIVGGEG